MRTGLIALRLATRNLRRNRRRTLLTTVGLTIGLIVMIVAYGMLDGMSDQSMDSLIGYETAHLRGYPHGYLDDDFFRSLDELIPNVDSLRNAVVDDFDVSATIRLHIQGRIISGREEGFIEIVGVEPGRDTEVYRTLNALVEGRPLESGVDGALIGHKLAKDMDLSLGDRITLFAKGAPGAYNSRRVPVRGILHSGHPQVDGRAVFLPLAVAQELALVEDAANEIAVLTDRRELAPDLRERLTAAGFDLDWQTWEEAAAGFTQIMQFRRIVFGVIILILAGIAAVAVSNTMIMAVHERTREIGALRAMGFSRPFIGTLFLFEGVTIGLLASVLGALIGGAIVVWLNHVGIPLTAYEDIETGLPVSDAFYPALHTSNIVIAISFGLVLTAIASWSAARRAQRGEVVRALREGQL